MGNSQSKPVQVDGGSLKPFGILYPLAVVDYDQQALRRAIIERRLSPFYLGREDLNMKSDSVSSLPSHKSGLSEKPAKSASLKKLNNNQVDVLKLWHDCVECPICFLYYPKNINYTRCCVQMICTDCFVQIKRNEMFEAAECPYCCTGDFGVVYSPVISASNVRDIGSSDTAPESVTDRRKKSVSHKHPSVLTSGTES